MIGASVARSYAGPLAEAPVGGASSSSVLASILLAERGPRGPLRRQPAASVRAVKLHEGLAPLAALLGTWRGEGRGEYPSVEPFSYVEELRFSHDGRAFLLYEQRTWRGNADGPPSHGEMGYWRAVGDGRVELVLTHTTGVTEIAEGTASEGAIDVRSTSIQGTSTAKEVTELRRSYRIDGETLRYELQMAALGHPLSGHLRGELRRER